MGLHWQEIIILLVLALVIFGPKRLPEIGRSLGKGMREFKDTLSGSDATAEVTAAGTSSDAGAADSADRS